MIWGDYHIHTIYSGGKVHATNTPEIILQRAKQKGLKQVGICDHGINHFCYGTTPNKIKKLKQSVDYLNSVQNEVNLMVGIEANITSFDGNLDIDGLNLKDFDVVVAGFHKLVWSKKFFDGAKMSFAQVVGLKDQQLKKQFTNSAIKVIKSNKIDILAHPSYGVPIDVKQIAQVAIDYNVAIELNGKRICMTDEEILYLASTDVKLVANSDAHTPDKVGDVSLPIKTLQRLNIPKQRLLNYQNLAF